MTAAPTPRQAKRFVPRPLRIGAVLATAFVLAAQLVLVVPAAAPAAFGGATDVAAAELPPATAGRAVRSAEAGGCSVTTASIGGTLTSCPDVDSYANFIDSLSLAFDALRATNNTSPLSVDSDPRGADVFVDGIQLGVTPLQTSVAAGSHLVELRKDGYADFSHTVTTTAGSPTSLTKQLEAVGGQGSYKPVLAGTLIGLLGGDGFSDGDFTIHQVVRDRDGNYYVSFENSKEQDFSRAGWPSPGNLWTPPSVLNFTYVSGVAETTDNGATWRLVGKWRDNDSLRLYESRQFDDAHWTEGKHGCDGVPCDEVDHHWVKLIYSEKTTEDYSILNLIPRADTGISIQVRKHTTSNHYISDIYDNLPAGWCRSDDIPNTNGVGCAPNPNLHFSDSRYVLYNYLTHETPTDKWQYLQDTYGLSDDDLDEHATVGDVLIQAESIGGETQVAGWPTTDDKPTGTAYVREAGFWGYLDPIDHKDRGLEYLGRHEDADTRAVTDYFFEYSWQTSEFDCTSPSGFSCKFNQVPAYGTIVTSTDGGRTLQVAAHFEYPHGEVNDTPYARLGPDGSVYLQADDGTISLVVPGAGGTATVRDLAPSVPIGQTGPGSFKIDDAGNAHLAWPNDTGSAVEVWYQFVPREPIVVSGTQLLTREGCDLCTASADYLKRAGAAFTTATKPGAYPDADYPVLTYTRDGSARTLTHATPTAISQALGLTAGVFVEQRPIFKLPAPVRLSDGNASDVDTETAADWVDLELDDAGPHIVVEHPDGVVSLDLENGDWTATPLTGLPTHGPDIIYRSPGGVVAGGPSYRPRLLPQLPFNSPGPRPDGKGSFPYAFLYNSDLDTGPSLAAGYFQDNYQLWTTEEAAATTSFEATAQVSQLIPAATLYIGLGKDGTPADVGGDLAGYVASQGVVTDGGDRYDRITLDLRTAHVMTRDGQLTPRAIAGWVDVSATDDTGAPENRRVAVSLYVLNTPLTTFDPSVPGQARDITVEAVHFTGDNERWVVTNNSALPDSVPCGPDQALYLDPHAVATYTAQVVTSWELGSCLDQLEVAPTVLADCTSWADAQELLAAETMASLKTSLRVEAIEDTTNYELALGSKDATVFRVVSLADDTGATTCGDDVGGATAVVVKVVGRILGGDEPFTPAVAIQDRGTQAVRTASVAEPRDLAWERGWLEFEGNFLETNLRLDVGNEALASVLFGTRLGRRVAYERELLAVQALHACNVEGVGIAGVLALVDRTGTEPAALQRAAACLTWFVAFPAKHWPTYDPRLWAGGPYGANFLGAVIDDSLATNPTLGFLAAAGHGDPVDYTPFVIKRILGLEAKIAGADDVVGALSTDFELDHYARLETITMAELGAGPGGLMRALVLGTDVERLGVRFVAQCAAGLGGSDAYFRLFQLTTKKAYTAGIPCVDAVAGSGAKIEAYQRLAVALHSGTLAAMFEAAGRDSDLLASLLGHATASIAAIQASDARYPVGAPISAWQPDLPALDRFVVLARQVAAITAARGRQMTLNDAGQVLAGAAQCGTGLVTGLVGTYGEGLLLLGLGAGAAVAGPVAAAGSGLIFLGSGVAFTGLSANDLAARWDQLDLTQKSAGLCGTAASAVMTLGATPGAFKALQLTKVELAFSPPKVIDVRTLFRRGKGAGQPIQDQAKAMGSFRESIEDPAPASILPPEEALRAIVAALPGAKAAQIRGLARQLGYAGMSPAWRGAFETLARSYGEDGGVVQVIAKRRAQLAAADTALPGDGPTSLAERLAPWIDMGTAFVWGLQPGRPKSIAAEVAIAEGPGGARPRLVGPDSSLVLGALDDGFAARLTVPAARGILILEAQADTVLLRDLLSSGRVLEALAGQRSAGLLTPDEVGALGTLRRAAWGSVPGSFLAEAASPRVVEALRQAVTRARTAAGAGDGAIRSVEVSSAGQGAFKNAFRLSLRIAGRDAPVDLAVKKGFYAPDEFEDLQVLAAKGLTQQPFVDKLLASINGGTESLEFEEFIDGQTVGDAGVRRSDVATALGRWDAQLFLRTLNLDKTLAWFNKDLHASNMMVAERNGQLVAKCIDFDPRFKRDATPDQYWGGTLLRRRVVPQFYLADMTAYLQGIVDGFAHEPGSSRATGLELLRHVAQRLRDPAYLIDIGQVQTLGSDAFVAPEAVKLADFIDTFLKANGGASLPSADVWAVTGQPQQLAIAVPAAMPDALALAA